MRILVTGSRTWTDANTIGVALYEAIEGTPHREVTIVHGACPRGATHTADLAEKAGIPVRRWTA